MFYVKDGWTFERTEDGGVRIGYMPPALPGKALEVELDANTWASVVASVTPQGETAASFARAQRMHRGQDA